MKFKDIYLYDKELLKQKIETAFWKSPDSNYISEKDLGPDQ